MQYHVEFDIDLKRNPYPGKLIALEGIDGSGKTTQVDLLADEIKKKKEVFITKNPTDGEIGKFIRKVLSQEIVLPSVTFQYLFSADRQVQAQEVEEYLKKGHWVVTDRYFWSALAYGVVDRGGDTNEANQLLVAQGILSHYHQFIVPDYTFYLEISLDTAMKRLNESTKQKELYEERGQLERIKSAYEFLLKKFPQEIIIIDGEKSKEEVTKQMLEKLTL